MKLLRSLDSHGRLTPSAQSLSATAVREIVRRYGALIGVPELNPHDLRRTYSQLARDGGAPIEIVRRSLGHGSVLTTERYLRRGEDCNAGDYLQIGKKRN